MDERLNEQGTHPPMTSSAVHEETASYLRRFGDRGVAARYNRRFAEKETAKHAKETAIIRRLLGRIGPVKRLLDMPSGCGRFVEMLREYADEVVEADGSAAMLEVLAAERPLRRGISAVRANAAQLPFRDGGFDAVVCIRFMHHLATGMARIEAMRELARVSSRYVLITLFDYTQFGMVRSARERLRGRTIDHKSVPLSRFKAEAAVAGLKVVKVLHAEIGSNRYFLLFEKCPEMATRVARNPSRIDRRMRVARPLGYLTPILVAAAILTAVLVDWRELEIDALVWALGLPIMTAGALLAGSALFFRRLTTSDTLPTEGPYALVRHPTVTGTLLWLSGLALMCELAWLVPLVVVGLYFVFKPVTELREINLFLRHHQYDAYCARTPRFVPHKQTILELLQPGWLGTVCRAACRSVYPIALFAAGFLLPLIKEILDEI